MVTNRFTSTQQKMFSWQVLIAFGPFALLMLLTKFGKLDAIPTKLFLTFIFLTTGWAVLFKGYLLYLTYQK